MKPHFVYERGDYEVTFTGYCGSPAEATMLRETLPPCGARWVQEQDVLTTTVHIDRLEEVIMVLEGAGCETTDGDARDFDAAHQDWDACSEEG